MPDETIEREPEQSDAPAEYKPKPPLWQSKPEQPRLALRVIASAALVLGTLALIAIMFEGVFLAVPVGQTEVRVIHFEVGKPADESPAAFRHLVELPGGARAYFVSGRVHAPGERLIVTVSRGRLTGRTWLGAPYRVVPETPSHSEEFSPESLDEDGQ